MSIPALLWRNSIPAGSWTVATGSPSGPAGSYPIIAQPDALDSQSCMGWSFGTPGQYPIRNAGTVVVGPALPVRQAVPVVPGGDDAAAIQQALGAGHDVILSGSYTLARAVQMPAGSTISASSWLGACVTRTPDNDYQNRMFVPQSNCTLRNLHLLPIGYAINDNTIGSALNFSMYNCRVEGACLGELTGLGALIKDSVFVRCVLIPPPNSLVLRCRLEQMPTGPAPAMLIKNPNTIAAEITFNGTDRGPVMQGNVSNVFLTRINLLNINARNGGCEQVLLESGTFKTIYLRHIRSSNSPGPFMTSNATVSDFSIDDVVADGWSGIYLDETGAGLPNSMACSNFDVEGGVVNLMGPRSSITLDGFYWRRPEWRRGGTFNYVAASGPCPLVTTAGASTARLTNGMIIGGTIGQAANNGSIQIR